MDQIFDPGSAISEGSWASCPLVPNYMVEKSRYPASLYSEPKTINEFFRLRAAQTGLTETQIAEQTGISLSTISRVFSGERGANGSVFLGICRIVGVIRIEELFPFFIDEHANDP